MSWDCDISEEAGVRYLHFGSEWVQGAMRLRKPDALELEYTRELMLGFVLRDAPWPRSALLVGLGAGSVAKFARKTAPDCRITTVEISPQVAACARQFFKLPEEDAHFRIVIDDAANYLAVPRRHVDLIVVDGFDPDAQAGPLDTDAFYANCRAHLTRNGLCAINLFGGHRTRFSRSVERIRRAFDDRVLVLPPCASGNVIAFGLGDGGLNLTMDELRERAQILKSATGLDLKPSLSRLQMTKSMPGGVLRMD